jgi:hypothetical protein
MAAIPDVVRPGDVISSELLNRIIRLLNEHDAQLGGGTGPLDISHVLPVVVRMGEELKVFGTGLSPANLKRVSVEGTDVQLASLTTQSDTLIAFPVPPILGIPDAGKTVVVTVENKGGESDHESFFLLPGVATNLEASFKLTRTTVTPGGVLAPSTPYEFNYAIEAFTSRDETYLLEPKLLNAAAGWSVAVKGGSNELLIRRSQPTPSTTPVVLVVTTGPAGGASLSLGLRAKNFANVTGSSMLDPVSIGAQPGAPNLDIEFLSPKVLGSVQKFANGSLYIRTDATVANQKAIINPLNVRLVQPGLYTVQPPVVGDQKWTVTIGNNPPSFDTTGAPNAIWPLTITVTAQAGAPDADVEIPIVGAGSLPDASFKFKVKLRADPSNPSPI